MGCVSRFIRDCILDPYMFDEYFDTFSILFYQNSTNADLITVNRVTAANLGLPVQLRTRSNPMYCQRQRNTFQMVKNTMKW